MANTIKILGLNDDNHATRFFSEDRAVQMEGYELIPFLAQAHSINYEVRGVYICDLPMPEDDEEDIFGNAFDTITSYSPVEPEEYDKAFALLWSVSSKNIYL